MGALNQRQYGFPKTKGVECVAGAVYSLVFWGTGWVVSTIFDSGLDLLVLRGD